MVHDLMSLSGNGITVYNSLSSKINIDAGHQVFFADFFRRDRPRAKACPTQLPLVRRVVLTIVYT